MARCIRMRQVLSAVILLSAVLKCILIEDGQGQARKDAGPLGATAADARISAHFPGRVLLEDPSFLLDIAGMTEPCHHRRDTADLEKQLQVLRKRVIDGDSSAVKSLLNKWSAPDTYVHNLKNKSAAIDQDYPQIQCSDLDYLATYQVRYSEWIYNQITHANYKDVSYMTMLELALHMTKGANQRALTMALNKNQDDVGHQGERSEDRIRIIRLLLEKGFLWGSGDLVCKVVHPESGYHTEVRQAFARTILHDLVRDQVHMSWNRINYLRQYCGPHGMNGVGMDGVVWILGSAPGAFTLLGVLSHKTVLMNAAQDDTNHDEAYINFPELIDLHKVLQAPVTTVDLDGWNAEMHAARVLKEEHVQLLKETTLEMWQKEGRDAFSIFLLGESASDMLSGACIFLALKVNILAYVGACFFMCCLLLHASLKICKNLCRSVLDCMLSCVGSFKKCKTTFIGPETLLRVLWLLTLNTAFLNFPPEIIIWSETGQNPFGIPSVSKWNPLPATVHLICCFCIIVVVIFAVIDYMHVRDKPGTETPAPARPEDRYQDPEFHFIGCVCVFGLVTILIIIYVKIVLKPLEMNPKRMGLWLGSVLVQVKITLDDTLSPKDQRQLQHAFSDLRQAFDHTPNSHGYQPMSSEGASHESSVGMHEDKRYQALRKMMHHWYRWSFCMVTPHNPDMWHLLMYAHKGNDQEMRIRNREGPAEGQWSWLEINSRFLMSYISNGFYKAIIVYTLPLWLSRGGLTDFVLNAFATVYIVELDDVTGCEWKLMPKTAYLKYRTRTLTGEDATEDATEDEEAEGFKGADGERMAKTEAGRLSMYSSEASTAVTGVSSRS